MINRTRLAVIRSCHFASSKRSYVVLKHYTRNVELSTAVQHMAHRNIVKVGGRELPSLAVTEFITQYDEVAQIMQFMSGKPKPETAAMRLGSVEHKKLQDKADAVEREKESIIKVIATAEGNDVQMNGRIIAVGPLEKSEVRMVDYLDRILYLADRFEPSQKDGEGEDVNRQVTGTYLEDVEDFEELESFDNRYPLIRELPLYGVTRLDPKFELRGIIDGVRIVPGSGVEIIETKTTRTLHDNPVLLQLAYHQTLAYHYMLSSMLHDISETPEMILDKFHVTNEALRAVILDPEVLSRIQHGHSRLWNDAKMSHRIRIEVIRYNRMYTYDSLFDADTFEQLVRCRTDLFTGKRMPFDQFLGDHLRHN